VVIVEGYQNDAKQSRFGDRGRKPLRRNNICWQNLRGTPAASMRGLK
jgi:hypothetical protein